MFQFSIDHLHLDSTQEEFVVPPIITGATPGAPLTTGSPNPVKPQASQPQPPWDELTRIPLKAELYERETYFREGWAELQESLGDNAIESLWRTAMLVVKPDGIVTGKVSAILDFLMQNEFSVTAVATPILGGLQWRELWRYQLTAATLDRLAINSLLLEDCVLVLFLRDNAPEGFPAAVRLNTLKGPSDMVGQTPNSLRRHLAQPNRVLSFIHVADEPADILREIAILLERIERRRVFAAFVEPALSSVDQQTLQEMMSTSERTARTLDKAAAIARIKNAVEEVSDSVAKLDLLEALSCIARQERISFRHFQRCLADSGAIIDQWDLITVGASAIVDDEPGATKRIHAVTAGLWCKEYIL